MIKEPINLIYVEDDPGSRKVMRMLISRIDDPVNLTIFEDSTDFIHRIECLDYTPDLFLIDIHVRPDNGFEMLNALRLHPRYADRMIVALTASVMNAEVIRLKEAGFDGVLAKPLNFHTFPMMMERILTGERIWSVQR